MLELHYSHPKFSMKKEVMCLLPKLPRRAEYHAICSDLGISRGTLQSCLDELREGYRVHCFPGQNDMAVGLPEASWRRMDREATEYYETVYGKDND